MGYGLRHFEHKCRGVALATAPAFVSLPGRHNIPLQIHARRARAEVDGTAEHEMAAAIRQNAECSFRANVIAART